MSFFWLLFAHAIGDVALQTPAIVNAKNHDFIMLTAHAIIWGGCVYLALVLLDKDAWWKLVLLVIGHMVCDGISSNLVRNNPNILVSLGDNTFHILQLLIVYLL